MLILPRVVVWRIGTYLVKLCILTFLCFLLYKQVVRDDRIADLWVEFNNQLDTNSFIWVLAIFLLLPLNWSMEALKWQRLASLVYQISFKQAFKSVVAGVSVGFFTPNRVGEIGGRLLALPSAFRLSGAGLSLIASAAQILVSFLFGMMGAAWLFFKTGSLDLSLHWGVVALVVVFLFGLLILYFSLPQISRNNAWQRKLPKWLYRKTRTIEPEKVDLRLMLEVFSLSSLRYFIYTLQYFLFLKIFGVQVGFGDAIACITFIFFIQTCLPAPAIIELGIRNNAALYLLGYFSMNKVGIISAASGLWLVNLLIPAIFGIFFLSSFRLFKQT